jgi:CheY-like chemotaxis protein/two-component sensor histidine kinase
MHIDVATSGKECIEKFALEHYDMVFLDYRMPQMNGIETLAVIQEKYPEEFKKTPIISLTASAVSGDKEKMIRAGFTDYLSKPVNIDEMERMMIKYLPQDSVILCEDGQCEEEDDELSKLPKAIFDHPELEPERGIEYCGDAEDYMFAIETFAVSIDAKADQIEDDLKNEDYEAFTINVHSLKSTSGAIGALKLSEKAKALEQAAKAGNTQTLKTETPGLLAEYRRLKDILNDIVDSFDGPDDPSCVPLAVVEEERSRMLTRALEEAERANLAKTAFLSNMSHEIRTPLNDIVGLYNIALRKNDIDDETKGIVTQIGSCARHLISLINDILDMSLIESGNIRLKEEEFSFGNMIEQVNTVVESQCDDKGIDFDCSVIGQMDDYYVGDNMKLKQVIFNILGNAIQYTPTGGTITFTVEEVERQEEKTNVRFVITDNGAGIDADYLPRIFEPFSKEVEGSSNRIGSTGLGMAITKNIVDLMAGHIEVRSEKGKGSSFTVTVPLGISNGRNSDRYSFDPRTIRALIVDDDVTACEHAKMILRRVGIGSEYVLNGEDALAMFSNHPNSKPPFNLLLVDWKMPGMDGIELTKRIRKNVTDEDITIILTTYNWYEIMEEAFLAGVDGFLAKPMFVGNIKEELGKVFAEKERNPKKIRHEAELSGRRVLLAEDMELNGEIMEQILSYYGIKVDHAANGEEAVKLFESSEIGTYDAILMDIRMPVMNGLDATRAIRKMDREDAVTVPVIALTADAFDEDVRMSLAAGMSAHLSKPIQPDDLFSVLRSLI